MNNESESAAKSRTRSRKKIAAPAEPEPTVDSVPGANFRNVGSIESAFSLVLGVLLVLTALFPRTIKQLFFLGLGSGLVYRGMTSHCSLYAALGLDSEQGSLIRQVNEKYLSPATR